MQANARGPVATLRIAEGVQQISKLFAASRKISAQSGILPGEHCVTVRRRIYGQTDEEILLAVDIGHLRSLREESR